eukprot:TRINITY_DN1575_c0_g2_i1.p1 TRINITY_DN1575_c0_g2~~TRINITY_DN1575_c0_g2_i1.p1  ORF type:complete len:228 (-),score=3.13 TRINITY_DN1575_c0_g2_i1:245-928(-)
MTNKAVVRVFNYFTYSWVFPLILRGKQDKIELQDALPFLGNHDQQQYQHETFMREYQQIKARSEDNNRQVNSVLRTYLSIYWKLLLVQFTWALIEAALRVCQPILLRQFLVWLQAEDKPLNEGLGWALGLGGTVFLLLIVYHQLWFLGMRLGFWGRQQAIDIVYHKLLRLNGQTIGDVSSGQVINLVSNDARRFEDACTFWVYLIIGPQFRQKVCFPDKSRNYGKKQ